MKMRRIDRVVRILSGVPSLIGFGAGLLVAAEPPLKPPSPPGGPGPAPGLTTSARGPGRLAPGLEQILTPEQRQQFRSAMEKEGFRMAEVERQLRLARRELENVVTSERIDEAAIRQKAQAIADLESRRAMMRARGFAAIRSSLTPDQLARIQALSNRAEEGRADEPGSSAGSGDPRMARPGGPPPSRPSRPAEPK